MKQVAKTVIRDFHTKIVGVTYGNSDGSSRQEYIKKLKPGDELVFRPVPTAEYPDAIGVFTLKGEQLGHLSAGLAAELKSEYPTNYMQATVANVTGGNGMNYGCNIHIVVYGEVSAQAENQPIDRQSVNQAGHPKRKTWLWVLGWIFIFPLPLTLIIAKNPNMNKALKIIIIVAAWVAYVLLGYAGSLAR